MITEDQLCLDWFKYIRHCYICGRDIAPHFEITASNYPSSAEVVA